MVDIVVGSLYKFKHDYVPKNEYDNVKPGDICRIEDYSKSVNDTNCWVSIIYTGTNEIVLMNEKSKHISKEGVGALEEYSPKVSEVLNRNKANKFKDDLDSFSVDEKGRLIISFKDGSCCIQSNFTVDNDVVLGVNYRILSKPSSWSGGDGR